MGQMWLPPLGTATEFVELNDVSSIVIVGANGSGKSRLGVWIDNLVRKDIVVHRVSAQRALTIEDYVQARSLEQATRLLLIGAESPQYGYSNKREIRWQNNPTSHLLNDFDHALSWLFADHNKTATTYREQCRSCKGSIPPLGESRLEAATRIWRTVMPQRMLVASDNKISVGIAEETKYAGREMSDGERVALYLIASCLSAPGNAIIVIDEPEVHLHQSIQDRLWDEIEATRPDCVFVYITHDLTFAASRVTARKIWVRSYDGKNWDWVEIEETEEFPEPLVFQILGSRRPILFVEGDLNSLDLAVYRLVYPERHVIPRGNCENVVNSTAALRSLERLHHTNAHGIIDRDYRTAEELTSFEKKGVFSTHVAEVENVFLTPDVIQFVSRYQKRDPRADLDKIQTFLFNELATELDIQINDRSTFLIQQKLNGFSGQPNKKASTAGFEMAVHQYLGTIDPPVIYSESEVMFRDILATQDYSRLLMNYNRKSLAKRISGHLGLGKDEYPRLVVRLMQTAEGKDLVNIMRSQFPVISN